MGSARRGRPRHVWLVSVLLLAGATVIPAGGDVSPSACIDVALDEADDVAFTQGGPAFGPVPAEQVQSETFVLQGMGDLDLECDDADGDEEGQALAQEPSRIFSEAPELTHVPIVLDDSTHVVWTIAASETFQSAAAAFCTAYAHRLCSSVPSDSSISISGAEIFFRDYVTKGIVLGKHCRTSPNFRRLLAGRYSCRLPPAASSLLTAYASRLAVGSGYKVDGYVAP